MSTGDRALTLGAVTGFLLVLSGVARGRPWRVLLGSVIECACVMRLLG